MLWAMRSMIIMSTGSSKGAVYVIMGINIRKKDVIGEHYWMQIFDEIKALYLRTGEP